MNGMIIYTCYYLLLTSKRYITKLKAMKVHDIPKIVIVELLFICICVTLEESMRESLKIPLTYSFGPDRLHKYSVRLSFNQSYTSTPFRTQKLMFYNQNITMQTEFEPENNDVVIGLKNPSSFLSAIQSTFGVSGHQIEFGKEEFLQLLINDNNYVEGNDEFIDEDQYTFKVIYNFGNELLKHSQICELVDSEHVYFDEMFILEVLNGMDNRNQISFVQNFNSNTITIFGQLQNFPRISLVRAKSIFELTFSTQKIHYIPRSNSSESRNVVGYKAMRQFSKFEVRGERILFKSTSELYQLYIFLGYFFAVALITIFFIHKRLQESMMFVKNVVKWVIWQDNQSRVRVLRTELENVS